MYIEVNVDVPYLRVFVDFLSKVELFFKLFPFLRGIVALSMKSTYNDLAWGPVVPLGQDLSTDNLIIVENLSGLLCSQVSFLEDNRAFVIMLVLGVLNWLVNFVFLDDTQIFRRSNSFFA